MWLKIALSALAVTFVQCTFNFRVAGVTKRNAPATVSCYDVPYLQTKSNMDKLLPDDEGQLLGWQPFQTNKFIMPTPTPVKAVTEKIILKRKSRADRSAFASDLIKEHAKLVEDINSLRQMVFVAPILEDREYDESVFPEIETSSLHPSTTTFRPSSTAGKLNKTDPILELGSSNQHQVVNQPSKFSKNTINLIGTSVTPLEKHPYPFVVQSSMKTMRICITPTMQTTTTQPSLWQRLLNSLIPR